MQDSIALDVYEGRTLVGRLTRLEEGHYNFEYAASYIHKGGHALCVTMPTDRVSFRSETLHPFFTNYLSEGWFNETQKRHLTGAFSPTTKIADLLLAFGNCFGAMSFRSADHKIPLRNPHFEPDLSSGFENIEPAIGNAEEAMIPGAQPKLLVRPNEDGLSYRLAKAGEKSTHIAKITHKDYRYPGVLHNELLATQITKHLLPEDDVCEMFLAKVEAVQEEALLIRRFDRTPHGKRVAFYEFNQLLGKGAEDKYEGNYAAMIDFIYEHAGPNGKNGFCCDLGDARRLFRRFLTAVLIGNTDAHFKNYSLMKNGDRFTLTPNYDLVSSSMYFANRKEKFNQFALHLGGKKIYTLNQADAKRLILFAHECQITPQELLDDVRALKERLNGIEPLIAAYDKTNPNLTRHFRTMIRSRWNGGFDLIEKTLAKNPPRNIFANKTSRMEAEKALNLAPVRNARAAPAPTVDPHL